MELTLSQVLAALRARWLIGSAIALVIVLGTLVVSLLLPKQYTATATVLVEPSTYSSLGSPSGNIPLIPQAFMGTQVDVVQSTHVAALVVEQLGITKNAKAIAQYQEEHPDGGGSLADFYAAQLLKTLKAKPGRESMIVDISFTGAEPHFAAQVANAFADAYLRTQRELRSAPAREYSAFFDSEAKELRTQLEAAQQRLSKFQQEHGITETNDRLDIENSRLEELSANLVNVQTQAQEAHSRAQVAGADSSSIPEVSGNGVIQSLRADIAREEAKLAELGQQYGEKHPTYQRQLDVVHSLHERLQHELGNATGSVTASDRAANVRVEQLHASLEAQRHRVLELKQQHDAMAVLQREVDNAQKAFDTALQRFTQTRMESQSTLANATLLNAATPPGGPSSPRVLLNLLIAVFAGTFLGASAALAIEFRDRRIRSPDDLARALGVSVVCTLPPPTRGRARWPWQRLLAGAE
jgi:chain length determinant protein EpsF